MYEADIVQPSDSEELEEIHAESDDYWEAVASATSALRRDFAVLWHDKDNINTTSSGLRRSVSANTSPARKRIKLAHDVDENDTTIRDVVTPGLFEDTILPVHKTSMGPGRVSPDASGRVATIPLSATTIGANESSQTSSYHPILSSMHGPTSPSPSSSFNRRSLTPPLIFPTSQESESGQHRLESLPPYLKESTTHSPSQHVVTRVQFLVECRGQSADPLLLSTPSRREIGLDRRNSSPIIPITPQTRHPRKSLSTSPLTPIQSPHTSPVKQPVVRPPSNRAPSPNAAHDSDQHAGSLAPGQPHAQDDATMALLAELDGAEGTRYSLRTRKARQLNPYEYDKIMYKRQMRAIPDAIVKMRSPPQRRHDGSRGPRDDASSDPDVDPNTLDMEDSDQERPRRRRSRSAASHENLSGGGGNPVHVSPRRWRPRAFNDTFSSDSDVDDSRKDAITLLGKQPNADRQPGRVRRKYRAKPFPLSDKALGKLPSQEPGTDTDADGQPASTRPRRLSWFSSDDDQVAVQDGPRDVARQTTSPEPPDDDMGWHRQDFDEDIDIPRGSPGSHPPTSSSAGKLTDSEPATFLPRSPSVTSLSPGARNELHALGRAWPYGDLERAEQSPPRIHDDRPLASGSGSEVEVVDDGHDVSDDSEDDRAYRKLKKILKRVRPGVEVDALLHDAHASQRRNRRARDRQPSVDGPLIPGQARTKIRTIPRADIEIRGDSESSDTEPEQDHDPAQQRLIEISSSSSESAAQQDSDSAAEPESGSERGRRYGQRVIVLDSDEEDENREPADVVHDDIDDEDLNAWLEETKEARPRQRGAREPGLVDYMLSRNRTGTSRPKARGKRGGRRSHRRSSPRTSSRAIHVATNGLRRRDSHRQTLISEYADTGHTKSSRRSHAHRHSAQGVARNPAAKSTGQQTGYRYDFEVKSKSPSKKNRKRHAATAGVHVFSGGAHITSGRSHARVTIDAEAEVRATRSIQFMNRSPSPPHKRPFRPTARDVRHNNASVSRPGDFVSHDRPTMVHEEPQARSDNEDTSTYATVDAGISVLKSGTAFGMDTYIRRGWLVELLNVHSDPPTQPTMGTIRTATFTMHSSVSDFVATVEKEVDWLCTCLGQDSTLTELEDWQAWLRFFHATAQHTTWFLSRGTLEDGQLLASMVERLLRKVHSLVEDRFALRSDPGITNQLMIEAQWAVIELRFRLGPDRLPSEGPVSVVEHVKQLMRHLWACNATDAYKSLLVPPDGGALDYNVPHRRLAELWVCLIHISEMQTEGKTWFLYWETLDQALRSCSPFQEDNLSLKVREGLWRVIFISCAFSQFSVHGMTTSTPRLESSWKFVTFAMGTINLTNSSRTSKVAKYVKVLIARCMFLHKTWKWKLVNAFDVFRRLIAVFKDRQFANLPGDEPEFPSFLRHHDLRLLSEQKSSDSAFTELLKLMVQAVKTTEALSDADRLACQQLHKHFSVAVPIGSVSFANPAAPLSSELSKLYNRLISMAVVIYLDPSPGTARNKLIQARRYVDFKGSGLVTRKTCIRGLMYLTVLLRHFSLPLSPAMEWLSEMTNVLVEEFYGNSTSSSRPTRPKTTLCIGLILGSVRHVIQTPRMDTLPTPAAYPDVALLKGPWIESVLSSSYPAPRLDGEPMIRKEIRLLVQAFLDARAQVVPKPARPRLSHAVVQVQEESQEDYGSFDFNLDDPDLQAALGAPSGDPAVASGIKKAEEEVCLIMKEPILPAIYRMVCSRLADISVKEAVWNIDSRLLVDVWLECAGVLVHNNQQPWDWYLNTMGPDAWKCLDGTMRHEVEVFVKLKILKLDPAAYAKYQDHFLSMLFQSLAVQKVTTEPEYIATVLTLDGLQHPLLSGIHCNRDNDSGDFLLPPDEFSGGRQLMLDHIFSNLSALLSDHDSQNLPRGSMQHVEYVSVFFRALKETYEGLDIDGRRDYMLLCKAVYESLSRQPALQLQAEVRQHVDWLSSIIS